MADEKRKDPHAEYWAEALGYALESIGRWDSLTTAEMYQIGQALAVSAENVSTAFGYDAIPNPENAEIADLKRKLVAARAETDKLHEHAARALERSLNLRRGTVSIGNDGRISHYDGRSTEILL